MRIGILSRAPSSYATKRLRKAADDRGHDVQVLDTLRFAIDLASDEPDLQYRGRPLPDFDIIIPRIGASITYFGTAVVRQFEQMDVYTPNSASAIAASRDKLRAFQILSRYDIGIPKSTYVRDRKDVPAAIQRVGGAPVVIKLIEGTQGIGVILAPDADIAEAIVETLHSADQNVIMQQFIDESRGRDIRAFVIGNRVVASMRRTASGNEFRSNLHRGGTIAPVDITPAYERAAVRAAQILGLHVAGVDLLESKNGPLVIEVNSSPGLQGIEAATGLDVAGAIMDYVANQVGFPTLDVRQKLGMAAGYGVAEIVVREGSDLVGQTIDGADLRGKDISVLTLQQGISVIPNPDPHRILQANDRLTCFGRLESMRGLIPDRRKRRVAIDQLPGEPL